MFSLACQVSNQYSGENLYYLKIPYRLIILLSKIFLSNLGIGKFDANFAEIKGTLISFNTDKGNFSLKFCLGHTQV